MKVSVEFEGESVNGINIEMLEVSGI